MKAVESFTPREVGERVWGRELLVAHTPNYTGKVDFYKAGKAGGLQFHRLKDETLYLYSGEAWVDSDDGAGKLIRVHMTPGMSIHIPPGAPHRFEAITDCVVFETSTPPVTGDRVRCEEHYGVEVIGDEYGLETTEDDR